MPRNALWRLIRLLLVALGAPARAVARVWVREVAQMQRLAALLKAAERLGYRLRYDGEDEATLIRRWRQAAALTPPSRTPAMLAQTVMAIAALQPLASIDSS